ncbi:Glycerol-3-phosphate-binding protein [Klebsiella pneumoniae IS46]|nr:Glycerol-3-phosphate-binding protein [Klebsiella pneumoniae IS46]
MFNPLTALTVGLSLALSGAALAKEKIDFMFPAPVDGKLTMEMTRVIKNVQRLTAGCRSSRHLHRQL